MGRSFYYYLVLFSLVIGLTGCRVIADIFEAGLIVGIILVVLVVAIILWIVRAVRRRV